VPLAVVVGPALPVPVAVPVGGEPVPVDCVTGKSTELAAVKVDDGVPVLSLSSENLSKNPMIMSLASSLVGPSPRRIWVKVCC
jgi:hypothetical protein